jgi:hypothetical protein
LRLNQEAHAPRLHVHGTDHTRCHPTSRSPGHRVPNLCLIISGPLHQVSYSCHDPHRCPSYRTCQLHTTRQANMILHMNQRIKVKLSKCLGFEFKSRHVNDSSHQTKELTTWLLTNTRTCKRHMSCFLVNTMSTSLVTPKMEPTTHIMKKSHNSFGSPLNWT